MDTQPCRAPEYHDMAYKTEGAPHHVRPHRGNAEPVTSVPGAACPGGALENQTTHLTCFHQTLVQNNALI
jgi:hypothetical protein